ncbi:hypothetical protein [Methylobacterium sp. NEAU K]|uniref:hypothetical protein n=1 Tax=Methylobacterium sp. NEAU K TaxID=3064946 RepID=UPI002736BF2E|nr:hypothetical protein [Methylobacterium sp. NEAU K]MDP4004441.1 hypothetical protein [Methylobacterium sp. NEAU K]
MNKTLLATAIAALLVAPASAQVIESPTSTTVVVPPGAPGVVTGQSDATGNEGAVTYSPTGRAADTISNDSAAAGNADQPSLVAPQGGGGGGGR